MDTTSHTLSTLFAQLGLPSDETSIQAFIDKHHHLKDDIRLSEAVSDQQTPSKTFILVLLLSRFHFQRRRTE